MDELIVRAAIRDELSRPIEGIRREVRGLARDVDRTEAASRRADRSTRTWGLGLGRLKGPLSVAGSLTRGLTRHMGLLSTVGAAGVIAAIYKVGSAYSTQLNIFQGVTRATGSQMQLVRDEAQKLGRDLNLPATSAADAAAAMTELAKGGLSVRDSMLAAHGTLQLAAAASVEGAQAAQIQANTLNQFKLRGSEAGRVADLLANAANAASGEVTDVALALSYVGPVAHATGINLTDTATSIGLLAKNGILAEKAGTGLRGIIASLAHPSKKAAAGLDEMGIKAWDSKGRFVGMRSLIEQLTKAQKSMTKEQFLSNAAAAFGREPLAAITALAGEGATGFDAMGKAVGRQGGAAEVAAARNRGFKGALDGLKSTIEGIGIELYTSAEQPMTRWTRAAAEKLPVVEDRFKDLVTAMRLGPGNQDLVLFELSRFLTGDGTKLLPVLNPIVDALRDLGSIARSGGTIFKRDLWPPLKLIAELSLGAVIVGLKVLHWFFAFVADHPTVSATLWGVVAALGAYKAVVAGTALINGIRYLITGFKLMAASEGVVAAIRAITGATWLMDAAFAANPVGLVVAALAALAVAFVYAWKHSETFRNIVIGAIRVVGKAVLTYVDTVLWGVEKMLQAASHLPKWLGGGIASDALREVRKLRQGIKEMKDALDQLGQPVVIPVSVQMNADAKKVFAGVIKSGGTAAQAASAEHRFRQAGDTSRSMVAGGNFARTMAFHARMAGPGVKISNAFVGGGGLGFGSGDHQRGKALDLIGPGLQSYRTNARAAGAFAEFHGSGPDRHLHMAVGDTSSSRASSADAGPAQIVFAPQVTVQVTNPVPAEVDVSAATARGVRQAAKALEAYGYVTVPGGRGGRST